MQGIPQGSCFFIDFLRGFHEEREAEFTMKGYTPQKKDKREMRRDVTEQMNTMNEEAKATLTDLQ